MCCVINDLSVTNELQKIVVVVRIFISMSTTFFTILYRHLQLHTFTWDLLKYFFYLHGMNTRLASYFLQKITTHIEWETGTRYLVYN
jgi:hypothetical protein